MDGELEKADMDGLAVGARRRPFCELSGDWGGSDGETTWFGNAGDMEVEPLAWEELLDVKDGRLYISVGSKASRINIVADP